MTLPQNHQQPLNGNKIVKGIHLKFQDVSLTLSYLVEASYSLQTASNSQSITSCFILSFIDFSNVNKHILSSFDTSFFYKKLFGR